MRLWCGALLALAVALSACRKKGNVEAQATEATADEAATADAVTERHDAATVSWVVTPDGKVKAIFSSPDGKPLDRGITGTLKVRPLRKDAKPTVVKLEPGPSPGLYTAEIPKLDADLTELSYDVDVGGKPVRGALHLPRGGTRQLVATAKASVEAKKTAGKKGPNGGILQVAGSDLLEIVADKTSGQVRVYVLDDSDKPIPVGKRKVKLGLVSGSPEVVDLDPEPKGLFFTGKLTVKVNPVKLTVVLYEEREPEPVVVLCGWDPAAVIVVGEAAPTLELFVVVNWAPIVVVNPAPAVVVVPEPIYRGKGKWKHGKHHHKH